jgi:hypothetical protein
VHHIAITMWCTMHHPCSGRRDSTRRLEGHPRCPCQPNPIQQTNKPTNQHRYNTTRTNYNRPKRQQLLAPKCARSDPRPQPIPRSLLLNPHDVGIWQTPLTNTTPTIYPDTGMKVGHPTAPPTHIKNQRLRLYRQIPETAPHHVNPIHDPRSHPSMTDTISSVWSLENNDTPFPIQNTTHQPP